MILKSLGVYGWPERDENLLLASLLTGDPLLLIGKHGSAKTHAALKLGQALEEKFLAYDASKCMFEDVLGYPNVEKLKQGVIEYVPSPVTIWDKRFVLIDELNRAAPELQSKWLEIIRSRRIMGFSTEVKWVWAAMNPMDYAGANTLDEALVGRFSFFVYPPDVLQMGQEDRIKVALYRNGDDAPGLNYWLGDEAHHETGLCESNKHQPNIHELFTLAAQHYRRLENNLSTLGEFLAKFTELLVRESDGQVALDGRRLGFIHRNILAVRAIELAKAEMSHAGLRDFAASARAVVISSIPTGLNDESVNREEMMHKVELCFDLLSEYFREDAELSRVNRIFELFTTTDLLRKAELLLAHDLGEMAHSKAWSNLMASGMDLTMLAYAALQVEARRPGTVPQELLASLSSRIRDDRLSAGCIPKLENDSVEHVEAVEQLLDQDSDLAKLAAVQRVRMLAANGRVTPERLRETKTAITDDIEAFENLIGGHPHNNKGGNEHENLAAHSATR